MLPSSILTASTRRRADGESLNAIAYRRIKAMIVDLELAPASVLDESALADQLEIGLTPVRQALRRLALENLVVIMPRRGTLVADLNPSDLHKIFEMRIELEALAARLAAVRATPDQLRELEIMVACGREEAEPLDNRHLLHIDRQLHATLARCARNEFLEETLEWLYCHVLRLWNLNLDRLQGLQRSMDEHEAIAQAISRRDADEAAALMHAHVSRFQAGVAHLFR